MRHISIFLLLFTFTLTSCKDKDTEGPEILNYRFNDGQDNVTLDTGETIQVQATLTDNVNLKEVKVDIHNNFDGHDHKNDVQWSKVYIYEIEGTEYDFAQDITVPSIAKSGPYHCNIQAIDETGIESDPQTLSFTVTRPDAPELVITAPDFNSGYTISRGDTLRLEGAAGDETDLAKIEVKVKDVEQTVTLYNNTFTMPGNMDLSWDLQADGPIDIPIGTDAEVGTYTLRIAVSDSLGNYIVKENNFTVQ